MNIKRIFSGLVLIVICAYLLGACIKPDNPSSTYTLKGRILSDSTKAPLAGLQLNLSFPIKPIGSKVSRLRTYTDADGNFEFTNIPTARTWNLTLKVYSTTAEIITLTSKPKRGETVDWGAIYIDR